MTAAKKPAPKTAAAKPADKAAKDHLPPSKRPRPKP